MKITIPKVVKPLYLRDYAEGFGVDPESGQDAPLWVWVNPPLDVLREYDEVQTEITKGMAELVLKKRAESEEGAVVEIRSSLYLEAFDPEERAGHSKRIENFLAVIWSQGKPETQMSADEVHELIESAAETDPAFPLWLQNRTLEMIREHRAGRKKG